MIISLPAFLVYIQFLALFGSIFNALQLFLIGYQLLVAGFADSAQPIVLEC